MTKKKSSPPEKPPSKRTALQKANNELFWRSLKKAAIAHGALLFSVLISSLVGLLDIQRIQPSIQVDLVGLPDLTKKELQELNPKAADKTDIKKAKTKPKPKDDSKPEMDFKKNEKISSKEKNKRAIERLKALQKISEDLQNEAQPTAKAKGNLLSQGNSLVGTQGMSINDYAAHIEQKVRSNWRLPVWLSQKDYAAKTVLMLDATGSIITVVLVESSGNQQFDDFCIKAVRSSEPFGPPPKELRQTGITLGFPL